MPTQECKPLLDTCGMDIFSRNAFRLLAADVDQKARQIKRKEKELQAAIKVNDLADEYSDVLRPDPLPTGEELSQAGRELADAQQRFIHEFFWFWPLEWGKSSSDEILLLLNSNHKNAKDAQKRWKAIAAEGGKAAYAAKHNLAVMGHWQAVIQERKLLVGVDNTEPTREQRKQLNAYWNFAFKHWEPLCNDEAFWSMQADRIRALDDPRLTTGFLRRFSQSLPIAFDTINADLAVAYCDRRMYALAQNHVRIMKATNAGDDDVDASLRRVTEPIQARIDHAIETATSQLLHNKMEGKERCVELFNTVRSMLLVIKSLLGQESQEYIDTCDRVAESMLRCQVVYGNETKDWNTSIFLLEATLKVARGAKARAHIEENMKIVRSNRQGDVCWFCDIRPKEEHCSIKVTLTKSIRWQQIKSNPEQYRGDLRRMALLFLKDIAGMVGRLNAQGAEFAIGLVRAVENGDIHAIVRALDTHLSDWKEIMSQQVKATVPRCNFCCAVHSSWATETIGAIQRKLRATKTAIEHEATTMESFKKKIASHSQDRVRVGFLRTWWQSFSLTSLRRKKKKCKRRLQQAKKDEVRLQTQLKRTMAEGEIKDEQAFEAWPAVVKAKNDGFHIS